MSNDTIKQPQDVMNAVRLRQKRAENDAKGMRQEQYEYQRLANSAKAHADRAEAEAKALADWLQQNGESIE